MQTSACPLLPPEPWTCQQGREWPWELLRGSPGHPQRSSLGASAARFPTAWPEGCPPDTLARWFLPTLALQMGSVIPRPLHLPPSSLKSCSLAHLPTRRGCRARIRSVVCRASRACADAPRAAGTETLVRQLLTVCLLLIGGSPTDTRVVWRTHVGLERPTRPTCALCRCFV